MLFRSINIDSIADMTVYFSGAMIENLINEAALLAIRRNSYEIKSEHINQAYLEILAGAEKKNPEENCRQKTVTAYHESGHAFVSKYLMPDNKIIRVSVIPTSRGPGGYTLSTSGEDEVVTKKRIRNQLSVLMAGRVAEEIFFGSENITIGAQNDIEKATSLAVDYVAKYSMDEEIAFVNLSVLSEKLNIPLSSAENSIKSLVMEIYDQVRVIVENNKDKIEKIAIQLMEKEIIHEEELNSIING